MIENDGSSPASQASGERRRVARPVVPAHDAVILADISDSMETRDGGRNERMPMRRIDRLAKVLDYLLTRVRVRSLICFSDVPTEISLVGRVVLPEPAGSTNLALALDHVGRLEPRPGRTIIITDGMPNDMALALHFGKLLRPTILDCYYVGPEGYDTALRFVADLAAAGGPGGRSGHFDMLDPVLLGSELTKRLLAGPGRQ